IIVYTAGLASKPREIDQPLNVLRSITAQLQPGQQPTGDGQRRLIGVYQELESYLATQEPLRSFDVAELRRMIAREFNLEPPVAAQLWQGVAASA
ncbi:MAG TPA: hypothetical protein VLF67_01685, partial [Candidatus Saccharimonas sp.]|nr:hypothetical protein [Candidatus Saccharimonas sp.]